MAMTEQQAQALTNMVNALVMKDDEAGKAAFHEYLVSKSRPFMESDKGSAEVAATLKKTAAEEIKASGEAKDDPKKAKGSADVAATLKKTAGEEIKKVGEAKDDPKKAKGSAEVAATLKKTAGEEIK